MTIQKKGAAGFEFDRREFGLCEVSIKKPPTNQSGGLTILLPKKTKSSIIINLYFNQINLIITCYFIIWKFLFKVTLGS